MPCSRGHNESAVLPSRRSFFAKIRRERLGLRRDGCAVEFKCVFKGKRRKLRKIRWGNPRLGSPMGLDPDIVSDPIWSRVEGVSP